MSDSEASSPLNSEPSSPAPEQQQTSTEKLPTQSRFDNMFSDHESGGEDNAHDSDEDVSSRKRSRKEALGEDEDDDTKLSDNEAKELGSGDEDEDLFGDDDDDVVPATQYSPEPSEFIESLLPRHPVPTPGSDGHLYLVKCPSLFSISPTLFDPHTFTTPTLDTESGITLYTAATTAIRFRHHPNNPSQLQSNARIIRWSDGSLSLQVASSTNMWDLPDKALTSDPTRPNKYEPKEDSHMYLLDPHEAAGTLRVVGHATKQLKIVSSSIADLSGDTGVQKLRNELSKSAAERKNKTLDMSAMKDPEQERRDAEKMLKEQEKIRKRQEAKKNKERANQDRALNKRSHGAGTRSKRDSPPIYSRGSARKEDEYDLEDDFIEGSEEEEEIVDDDEEEEEEFEDHRRRRGGGSHRDKRRRVVDEDDEDDE